MKKIFPLVLILILLTGFLTSCKKDKGEPPVLPPQESMIIDFSNFVSTSKSEDLTPGQKGTENSNWEYAATVAGVWNLIINTTLAVPVAAFKAAVNQTPGYLSSKTWQWTYEVTASNTTYKARLVGVIGSSEVQWKMYITGDGTDSFPEFLWFEGTSKIDGTGGQWILNQNALTPVAFLQIDWTKTATTVGYVKYTYVKNDAFLNSYIEYGLTSNVLNAYYTIHYYNGVKFSDVNIEWNTTSNNGHVKSVDYLGDLNWYCWDSNKVNTVCQ
ncbi:MAG: hypothetical protein ABR927_02945 [Bacteroidales bacterium]|jgi:hypothetical protein